MEDIIETAHYVALLHAQTGGSWRECLRELIQTFGSVPDRDRVRQAYLCRKAMLD